MKYGSMDESADSPLRRTVDRSEPPKMRWMTVLGPEWSCVSGQPASTSTATPPGLLRPYLPCRHSSTRRPPHPRPHIPPPSHPLRVTPLATRDQLLNLTSRNVIRQAVDYPPHVLLRILLLLLAALRHGVVGTEEHQRPKHRECGDRMRMRRCRVGVRKVCSQLAAAGMKRDSLVASHALCRKRRSFGTSASGRARSNEHSAGTDKRTCHTCQVSRYIVTQSH